MLLEKWFNIDLLKPPAKLFDIGVILYTGDDNGVRIGVNLSRGGEAETATGTVNGYVIIPDGSTLPVITGETERNRAWIDLPEDAMVLTGGIQVAIRLVDGTQKTTVFAGTALVHRIGTEDAYDPSGRIPTWDDVESKIEQMDQATAAAIAAAAAGVRTDTDQGLTDTQKAQARSNIGAASTSDIPSGVVLYTAQTLTDEQKTQARTNIASASTEEVNNLKSALYNDGDVADTWVSGTLDATNGSVATSTTRIRLTIGDSTVTGIKPTNGYSVLIYAYNLGAYVGCWSGSGFTKTIAQIKWVSNEITFAEMGLNYQYKIVAKNSGGTDISTSDGANILLVYSRDRAYTDKIADEIVSYSTTGSVSAAGNSWKTFRIRTSHTYIFQNTGSSTLIIDTVNMIASYDYVETVGTINPGRSVTFAPTKDADYLHIYSNGAGSYTVTDTKTIDYLKSELTSGYKSYTDTVVDNVYQHEFTDTVTPDGNKWYAYTVRSGHRYRITNAGTSTGVIKCYTTSASGSWTNIQDITGSDNVAVGKYIEFTATADADYIRIYRNAAATYTVAEITTVDWLIDRTSPNFTDLPPYYTAEYLDGILDKINAAVCAGYTSAFAFITDMHTAKNRNYSGRLLQYIAKHTALPFVLYGGDTVMAYASTRNLSAEDAVLKDIEIWKLYFADILSQNNVPLFNVHGNHDFTIKDSESASTGWTAPNGYTVQQVCGNSALKIHGEPGKAYYYFDDEAAHIRYIVLDEWSINSAESADNTIAWGISAGTNTDVAQYTWLANALNVNDYTVVVFAHASPDPDITDAIPTEPLWKLLKAFKNHEAATYRNGNNVLLYDVDFTSNNSDLAFTMSGHWHNDTADFKDGILNIVTTCDSYEDSDSAVTRTQQTTSEQAFDYVVVDTTNKTVKTVRVGGGNDRAWNYETGEEIT